MACKKEIQDYHTERRKVDCTGWTKVDFKYDNTKKTPPPLPPWIEGIF